MECTSNFCVLRLSIVCCYTLYSHSVHQIIVSIPLKFFGRSQSLRKYLETIHLLAQFLFTASETELDYYHQKISVELPYELSNDLRLRILGN